MTAMLVDTRIVAGRHVRFLLRQPGYIFITLASPLVYLLLFSQLFSGVANLPGFEGSYLAFLLPGIVVMAALSSGGWAGTTSLEDMDRGVLNRLLVTPVNRAAIITGHLMQGTLVISVQTLVLAVIGALLGARYATPVAGVLVLLVASALLGSASGALSHALALTSRNQTTLIAASQAIVLPLTFVSTAFLPSELMPAWMATVAGYNPLSWAADASRMALEGGDPAQVALRLVWLAALVAVSMAAALKAFGRYRRAA